MRNVGKTPDLTPKAGWEKPQLERLGDIDEVVQFPGTGKVSPATYDGGDPPKKPKGQT